ncbi:MAG: sulfatase-like hydrolase/transferase [Verrucomicrobiales bacterium]|nr:sulfatase-like hydrolase/transferase [Verrucomicrobiales bacterium]
MNLRFVFLFLIGLSTCLHAADRPNVVWIVSEDNSKHYLKLFDDAGVETPNIAALAEDGVTFTRAFSNSPVCSVARTTLATGCYAPRIGTQFHRRSKLANLSQGLRLFPSYLREIGYYTTNNSKKDYNCVESEGTWDESSKTASWRDRPDKEAPFFHMESHGQSHESSLHFTEDSYRTQKTKNDPEKVQLPPYFPDTPLFRYTYARYLDNIQTIDEIVGNTVAKLEEDGVLEDTFIFYFGDHGGVLPRGKGYIYESGLHVPLVIRIPENFRELVNLEPGASNSGFVSFIDFGPTVLNLAGVDVPTAMDGEPFLGKNVTLAELAKRDSTFGYADRFDEKYEMIRTLRIGDWKYIRSFQPYYPDGLQNNYRYKMLAYREWRDLYNEGKLGSDQRHFFEPKPAEMLFDLSTDPHEVNDLSADPSNQARLLEMRGKLSEKMRSLPDLSLFPENVLYDEAMDAPVAFGEKNRGKISTLLDTADLMLHPISDSEAPLRSALRSADPMIRAWALTSCAALGESASELMETAKPLLHDEDPIVRVRAAEFLGLNGAVDPRGTLIEVVNESDHPVVQLIALNAVALFHDHSGTSYPFEADDFTEIQGEAERRILYLQDDWIGKKPKKKGKKKGNP